MGGVCNFGTTDSLLRQTMLTEDHPRRQIPPIGKNTDKQANRLLATLLSGGRRKKGPTLPRPGRPDRPDDRIERPRR